MMGTCQFVHLPQFIPTHHFSYTFDHRLHCSSNQSMNSTRTLEPPSIFFSFFLSSFVLSLCSSGFVIFLFCSTVFFSHPSLHLLLLIRFFPLTSSFILSVYLRCTPSYFILFLFFCLFLFSFFLFLIHPFFFQFLFFSKCYSFSFLSLVII